MMCAPRYFRHLLAMSITTTLRATAPLLYPCRRYPKCQWVLYASPPPVAMAIVGWFLCPPPPFFLRDLHQKKIPSKKTQLMPKKKLRNLRQKRVTLISEIELRFPPPPSLSLNNEQ